MGKYIFKMRFESPVSFGAVNSTAGSRNVNYYAHSDTLFSAISNEWIRVFGIESFNNMLELTRKGEILFSDLLPFLNEELFLPKPIIFIDKDREKTIKKNDSSEKKILKKLEFIPITKYIEYLNFVSSDIEFPFKIKSFVEENVVWKMSKTYSKNTMPYVVDSYIFKENAGLYFIAKLPDDLINDFYEIFLSSGLSGIGGRKSSGFGKYVEADDPIELAESDFEEWKVYKSDYILSKMLAEKGEYYVSLSSIIPEIDDIKILKEDNSYYSLIKRNGFVYSDNYSKNMSKRKQIIMMNSGSCFKSKIKGEILDLSDGGNHPVYKYGKGIFIGVNINVKSK